jgi:predicted XRE-type DNA-binding protein
MKTIEKTEHKAKTRKTFPYEEHRNQLPPEVKARAAARTREMLLEINLAEIRHGLTMMSQDEVAKLLDVTQPYVSKLERQSDMKVSTLTEYVQALGGSLEIKATVAGREMVVGSFGELQEALKERSSDRR